MSILNRYISQDFISTFILTLLIFTFVMCIGAVVKAIDLVSKGVSAELIIRVFIYNIPFLLTFTIPMSTLTTILLLFNRLSFDGELTAMRACGMSLWQIISPVLLISIVLSIFCAYLSTSAAPKSHFARRTLISNVKIQDPVNLLEEGRFVKGFPGMLLYVGKKTGDRIRDIVVYELEGSTVVRNVRAKSGKMYVDDEKDELVIDLYDVRIDQPDKNDPMDPSKSRNVSASHYPVRFDLDEVMRKSTLRKKTSDMTFTELVTTIRDVRIRYPDLDEDDLMKERMTLIVEANERLALSMSCFAFAMLGIPLGMKSRRKESSVGIGISLILVFLFYFFIIIANSLVGHPHLRPDLVVWIPVLVCEVLGYFLIRRIN